jgi:hypothetical protein
MADGDPQVISDSLAPEDRFQEILADPAQRTLALGSAADQLFSPQLSGEQQTLVEGAVKNRIARGLRGAAAEQFGQQIATQFEEQNRLAALGFLQQGFGASTQQFSNLPSAASGLVTGGGIAGLQAFGMEAAGLQSLALQGPGKLTEYIQGAMQGGDRASALQALFPSLQGEEVEAILDPESAVEKLIAGQETELKSALALEGVRDPLTLGRGGFSIGETGTEDVLGSPILLQLTPENLQRLGLPDPAEVGGLARLSETVDLRTRFAEAFPDFPADLDIRATAAVAQRPGGGQYNPLTHGRTATQELVGVLEIQPQNLTSRLQAIKQVMPGVADKAVQFARNIETLEDFRGQLSNPLQSLDLLPNLREQIAGVRAQSPGLGATTSDDQEPGRPVFRRQQEDPFQAQLDIFEQQLNEADELRETFFSPTQFFGS